MIGGNGMLELMKSIGSLFGFVLWAFVIVDWIWDGMKRKR